MVRPFVRSGFYFEFRIFIFFLPMDLEIFFQKKFRHILPDFFHNSNRFNSIKLYIVTPYGYSIVKFLFLFQISEKNFYSPWT